MTVDRPIDTAHFWPGQPVLVLDTEDMTRRGYTGREGVIDRLGGEEFPDMAMVMLHARSSPGTATWVMLPLASLCPIKRTQASERAS